MNKLILLLLCAFSLSAEQSCKQTVEQIKEFPGGKALFETVEKQGSITISYVEWQNYPFQALWDGSSRAIYINTSRNTSEGKRISSILFELHNARSTVEMEHLYDLAAANVISKEEFVESIEWMEHQNLLSCSKLILDGIEAGIFPEESFLPVMQEFHSHYQVQQLLGHSEWLASRYDESNPKEKKLPYRGTLDFVSLSKNDRQDLAYYLVMRDSICYNTYFKEEYLERLHEEYAKRNRKKLLHRVFGEILKKDPLALSTSSFNCCF